MICDDALVAMLDADPEELAGHARSALSTHLATCERCQAVAQTLVAETRRMASVVSIETRRSLGARLARPLVLGAGLAAAALVIVAIRRAPESRVPVSPVAQHPFAELPLFPPMSTPAVNVTPPNGKRATVVGTSNPKITVVWLY
jgi:hypothetical protein